MASPTLTVIGLDAMTPLVLEPLRAAGAVPHLDRLLGQGASGVLRSTTHPLTPQAWTTMFTGVSAGRHGIWDFHERDESGYGLRPVNGSYRREPAVWQRLSAAGRRVGVINVPFTWPVDDVNGFALAGFDAFGRRDGFAAPSGLLEELEGRFGPLVHDHAFPVTPAGGIDLDAVRRAAEQRVELTLWLAERFDPELLVVVFMAADHAHHIGWDEWERSGPASPMARVYMILDEAVGALAGALGGDIMLVSDHGGGPLHGVVNLNAWLAEQGLLEYAGAAELVRGGQLQRMAAARALALWRRLPLDLRTRAKQRLAGLARAKPRAAELQRRRLRAHAGVRLWHVRQHRHQRAGARAARHRRAGGRVRGRAKTTIATRLRELRDPASGRPIVAAVHRREELFSGAHLERVPDLVVEFVDYEWLGKGNLKSRTEGIWDTIEIAGSGAHYVGSHRHEGIVALAGPSAAPGGLFASIEDVAPTIQYLLGEPIPESMEGQLIDAAIDPALLESRPPAYAAGDRRARRRRASLCRRRDRRGAGSAARPRLHRVGRNMRIAVFGLGYVGIVSAACLAERGHEVIGVDPSHDKVAMVAQGRSTIVEERIGDLVAEAVASGRLRATTDAAEAVAASDLALICVGTPSSGNGSLSTMYLERVADEIGAAIATLGRRYTVVFRSTMLPGTCEGTLIPRLEAASGLRAGDDFGVAVNPEFLREGTSVRDFNDPPKTVVGARRPAHAPTPSPSLYDGLPGRRPPRADRGRRDDEVRGQLLPRAQDRLRQRDGRDLPGLRRRLARRDGGLRLRHEAQHLARVPAARASRSAAPACPRTCARSSTTRAAPTCRCRSSRT